MQHDGKNVLQPFQIYALAAKSFGQFAGFLRFILKQQLTESRLRSLGDPFFTGFLAVYTHETQFNEKKKKERRLEAR